MRKALTILTLTMFCGCAAMAHGRRDAASVDEARQAIAAVNAQFERAVAAGDAAAIARLYTADAILLPDGGEMVVGNPAAIEALWAASFKAGMKAIELDSIDVERRGDLAIETGTAAITTAVCPKTSVTGKAKYVVVWQRGADAVWRLHRDIWNADPKPAAQEMPCAKKGAQAGCKRCEGRPCEKSARGARPSGARHRP